MAAARRARSRWARRPTRPRCADSGSRATCRRVGCASTWKRCSRRSPRRRSSRDVDPATAARRGRPSTSRRDADADRASSSTPRAARRRAATRSRGGSRRTTRRSASTSCPSAPPPWTCGSARATSASAPRSSTRGWRRPSLEALGPIRLFPEGYPSRLVATLPLGNGGDHEITPAARPGPHEVGEPAHGPADPARDAHDQRARKVRGARGGAASPAHRARPDGSRRASCSRSPTGSVSSRRCCTARCSPS